MIVRFYPHKTVVRNDGFRLVTDNEGNGMRFMAEYYAD